MGRVLATFICTVSQLWDAVGMLLGRYRERYIALVARFLDALIVMLGIYVLCAGATP